MMPAFALDHRFAVTIFTDWGARTKEERLVTIEDLAEMQRTWHARSKAALPWIKLATFGNITTTKGSLRHDKNVLTVTGVEGDYDGEQIDPKEAVENLTRAGLAAIVSTSPSHTPLKPRWRVIAPFSRSLEPWQRDGMLDRLNGVLEGVLSAESWSKSQSYYCGHIDDRADTHETYVVAGAALDTMANLDAGAIAKPVGDKKRQHHPKALGSSSLGLDLFTRRLLGERELRAILNALPNSPNNFPDTTRRPAWMDRPVWIEFALAIAGSTGRAPWARNLFVEWSANFDGDLTEPERVWDTMPDEIKAGFSTVVRIYENWHGQDSFRALFDTGKSGPMFQSSGDFVKGFVPPEYIIEGIAQRRFCYSFTAPTGHGKTAVALFMAFVVATGTPFAGLETEQGRVGYFAGENPEDIRARWIALCESQKTSPEGLSVFFAPGTCNIETAGATIKAEAERLKGFDFVIIDTGPAFFLGDDDNSNAQMGAHARMFRSLTTIEGRPCVIVLMHPVKNPSADNLLPRGGGAFLAEVDGNLTAWLTADVVLFHWAGKLRGPGFEPLSFELIPYKTDLLKDAKGRLIPSVLCQAIDEQRAAQKAEIAERDEDLVLACLNGNKGISLANMARKLGWFLEGVAAKPNTGHVRRALKRLEAAKLVTTRRNKWVVTAAGKSMISGEENGENGFG